MEKVYVVSKEVFISEEDHSCDVISVCSSEELASKLVSFLFKSCDCKFKVNFFYEVFDVLIDL